MSKTLTAFAAAACAPGAAAPAATLAEAHRARAPVPSPAPATAATTIARPTPDFYHVNAVPYLYPQGRTACADFRNLPLPRAFAIVRNGQWGWAARVADARGMALQNCARRAGGPCEIYAVDYDVFWSGTLQ